MRFDVLLIGTIVLVGGMLAGCASTFTGICGAKAIGQNEQGILFFRTHCEATE